MLKYCKTYCAPNLNNNKQCEWIGWVLKPTAFSDYCHTQASMTKEEEKKKNSVNLIKSYQMLYWRLVTNQSRVLARKTRHYNVTLISHIEESISVCFHSYTPTLKCVVVNYQNDRQIVHTVFYQLKPFLGIKTKPYFINDHDNGS